MPEHHQDGSQILSVRLPHELIQRLDRYLDWSERSRQVKSSRNAALRQALSSWLDDQEQLAGLVEPHVLHQQCLAAYQSVSKGCDWVAIHQLRHLLPWPRERFDAVVEGLRADHHVKLESAESSELSAQAIQDSYHVHGHLYVRLRLCD
jgi:hypothetical protein